MKWHGHGQATGKHTKVRSDFINHGQQETQEGLNQEHYLLWLFDPGLVLCLCKWLGSITYLKEVKNMLILCVPHLFFDVLCLSEINIRVLQGSK